MPDFIANVKRWRERAKIDFFAEFVKAWIPFNAWYNQSYTRANNDREIINEIKRDSCIKTKLKHLLEDTDEASNDFRNHLAKFHRLLEDLELKNNELNVNFTNVVIERNNNDNEKYEVRGITYQVLYDKSQKKYIATVTNSAGEKILNYNKDEYLYSDFEQCVNDSDISETQKGYIKEAYKKINPWIPINLITTNEECICINNYKFINNTDKLSQAIIENIYSLRCMLFHGSIEPTEDTEKLYETAYYILKYMLSAIN